MGVSPPSGQSDEQRGIRVIAIIAAYNEADILGAVVDNLIDQHVAVYLIDDGSTDGTADAVADRVGKGLIGIERRDGTGDSGRYRWADILRRKQELAAELDGDWFLHQDADELRESPWAHLDLRAAVALVDRCGYSAIDFDVMTFPPIDENYRPGDDLRAAFPYAEPGHPRDRLQVRAWKRQATAIDLVSSGGHDAQFEGREVFPIRFLLRHYPIRGQAHGERKVFQERLPRFVEAERDRGWHVQYEDLAPGARFVRAPDTLAPFDAERHRLHLQLEHRDYLRVITERDTARTEAERLEVTLARAAETGAELGDALAKLEARLAASDAEAERARAELAGVAVDRDRLAVRVTELEESRTWRWTAAARWLIDLLIGARR